jgi:hypothetical protein
MCGFHLFDNATKEKLNRPCGRVRPKTSYSGLEISVQRRFLRCHPEGERFSQIR